MQLVSSFPYSVPVVAVHHKNQSLGILKVMTPQWPNLKKPGVAFYSNPELSDLVLSTNVPHSEGDVLVLDCLDVEAWNRHETALLFCE